MCRECGDARVARHTTERPLPPSERLLGRTRGFRHCCLSAGMERGLRCSPRRVGQTRESRIPSFQRHIGARRPRANTSWATQRAGVTTLLPSLRRALGTVCISEVPSPGHSRPTLRARCAMRASCLPMPEVQSPKSQLNAVRTTLHNSANFAGVLCQRGRALNVLSRRGACV